MNITLISDTHGYHDQLNLPGGDMLLHAGDVSGRGRVSEVKRFFEWFSRQDYTHKILIAGNHDFFFEVASQESIEQMIPEEVIYLNDSGVSIEGIHIWGSPISPFFFNWAFNRQRGAEIDQHWQLIPKETDILITHGPPYGILDDTARGEKVGCEDLLKKVEEIRPRLHVFGHIHEAYGQLTQKGIKYVNASVVNLHYQVVNPPIVLEWE